MNGEGQAVRSEIPMAPQLGGALAPLPESKQREWRETYARALKQAKVDHPEDGMEQRATATRKANSIFDIDEITTYKQGMALEPWQLLYRGESGGTLTVIPIDGKKYRVAVERLRAAAPVSKNGGTN
jgi:hypothetical protein